MELKLTLTDTEWQGLEALAKERNQRTVEQCALSCLRGCVRTRILASELRQSAPRFVAWEYVSLLAAAEQMLSEHAPPVNHQIQEAYLVHLRNMAEFFYKGTAAFVADPSSLPNRDGDTIFAVDLCKSVTWDSKPWRPGTRLSNAINKTLSHLTYSRDLASRHSEISIPFDGPSHLHGTVMLVRRTWEDFLPAVLPNYTSALLDWTTRYARELNVSLNDLDARLEKSARQPGWKLNETPDGLI